MLSKDINGIYRITLVTCVKRLTANTFAGSPFTPHTEAEYKVRVLTDRLEFSSHTHNALSLMRHRV